MSSEAGSNGETVKTKAEYRAEFLALNTEEERAEWFSRNGHLTIAEVFSEEFFNDLLRGIETRKNNTAE